MFRKLSHYCHVFFICHMPWAFHDRHPSWKIVLIPDSQSAKTAEGGEKRGFDDGKRGSGRKRNLLVDTLGLVVLAKVTAANVQDVHTGQQLLSALAQKLDLLTRLEKIFADGGYRGELVAWTQQNMQAV